MSGLSELVIKRIAMGVLTMIVISVLIFVGVEALPGDLATAILGQEALPETVAQFRKELKLDEPPVKRYFLWLGAFMRGDLGNSLANKRPVAELIFWRFKNTIFLAASAAVIAVPLSILLGILAALYRNSFFDRFISMATLSTISFPEFFVAYILIALLSVQVIIFPSISNINDSMSLGQKLFAIILPCLTLTLVVMAHMMRQTRAAIINILASPFIEMARLKGMRFRR
jgi:peptide/nickel transport system permease protein